MGSEALDSPATDPALVERIVADLVRSNRWLGGLTAMRYALGQLIDGNDRDRELTLLDIGTGAGDLPVAARAWARSRGVTLRVLGVERIAAAGRVARRAGVDTVLGCAGALPVAPQSVDIVLLSQVLHHLEHDSAVALLANVSAVARRGVVIADLRPTWYAAPGFRLAGRALRLHRVTIDDGVTSLRRGYRPAQLAMLCREAGVVGAAVRARPLARVVAWWRSHAT
jgi:SAM-dependent methyltransferase